MHRSFVMFALAILCAASAAAQVPPPPPPLPRDSAGMQRDAPQKTGTAVLRGRVVSAETGRPLRRVQVRAMSPELREGRSVSTDPDGRWEMKNMPAGRYQILFMKGGYVPVAYGQKRPFEQGKPLDVADAQTADKLDASLAKGGVIAGRIVDEFGEPVAAARVSAMRYRFVNGSRRLISVGSPGAMDTTDDLGQYRLHGLPPGAFYVSAVSGQGFGMERSDDRTGYAATYFPGTLSVAEAQRVTLTQGQEAAGIGFELVPTRVVTISGTVVKSSGEPVGDARVMLLTNDMFMSPVAGSANVKPDGSFVLSNVVPGDYRIDVHASGLEGIAAGGTAAGGSAREQASMPIAVGTQDISGLVVTLLPSATVNGRVIVEEADNNVRPRDFIILAASATPSVSMVTGGSGLTRDDWTFSLSGVSGRRRIQAMTRTPGWYFKSAKLNGNDITDADVDVPPGETLSGLEVTFTRRMAVLNGEVKTERGQPVTDYVVVLFAEDSAKWTPPTRYIRSARPDQTGKFVYNGLPPADYLIVAVEYLEPGDEQDPEVLARLKPLATRISIEDVETKSVALTLSK